MADKNILDNYSVRRNRIERAEIDAWMNAQAKQAASEEKKPAEPGNERKLPTAEEEAISSPELSLKSDIGDVLGVLLNPGELPSLFAGGAWQAYRTGMPILKSGLDWAAMGIPSLTKGVVGFGKGIIQGLGAKTREAAAPKAASSAIQDVLKTTRPEERITAPVGYPTGSGIPAAETVAAKGAVATAEVPKPATEIVPGDIPSIIKGETPPISTGEINPIVLPGDAAKAETVAGGIQKQIDEVGGQVDQLMKNWGKTIEEATRGTISHKEAITAGMKLGMGVDDVRKLYPGTPMTAEQASALVYTIKPLADNALDAAKRFSTSKAPADLHEALLKFKALIEVDPKRFGVMAESGRTLSQMNEPISGVNQYLDQFSAFFSDVAQDGITPEVLVAMMSELKTPEQLAVMARHIATPGSIKAWGEALMEGWIMGLLTGVRTHVVNFTSNMLTAIMGPVERGLSAQLAFGEGKHVVSGEATQMVYGMIGGFGDALSVFWKTLKSGESQLGPQKAEYYARKAISAEALALSGTFGRAVDVLGEVVRGPGRALVASDDLFKTINYSGNMRALALRDGTEKGLTETALSAHIHDFLLSPPERAIETSRAYANYMTFTKELDGVAGSMGTFLSTHPFMRVIFPFWTTPVNIFKFSLERTPVLNALSGQIRADIKAGGVQRDMAMGKMALGAMMSMTFYSLARAGYITGGGPSDKNLKDLYKQAGWQPDSVKIGKEYYSFSRVDPLSTFIGTMADLAEVSDELDDPSLAQYAMGGVLGFSNHMVTKAYLVGLAGVLEAIKEPDMKAKDYMSRWIAGLVPTIGRHIKQEVDPVLRETTELFDGFKSNVPGWSTSLPPKIGLDGKVRISQGSLGPDIASAIYKSTEKDDPVWKEIKENKIDIGPVPKFMGASRPSKGIMSQEKPTDGVELTPKEYEWLCRQAGNDLKVNGRGAWDELKKQISSPEYQRLSKGPYGARTEVIKAVINGYRELAQGTLRSKSGLLNEALIDKEKERIKLLVSGAKP